MRVLSSQTVIALLTISICPAGCSKPSQTNAPGTKAFGRLTVRTFHPGINILITDGDVIADTYTTLSNAPLGKAGFRWDPERTIALLEIEHADHALSKYALLSGNDLGIVGEANYARAHTLHATRFLANLLARVSHEVSLGDSSPSVAVYWSSVTTDEPTRRAQLIVLSGDDESTALKAVEFATPTVIEAWRADAPERYWLVSRSDGSVLAFASDRRVIVASGSERLPEPEGALVGSCDVR